MPSPTATALARCSGVHYLEHLREFVGQNLSNAGFTPIQDAITGGDSAAPGFQLALAPVACDVWRCGVAGTGAAHSGRRVSRWRKLDPNYIAALFGRLQHRDARWPAAVEATSLLQTLLRHSMLLEYASATAAIAGTEAGDFAALLRDPELIDLVNDMPLSTTWKRLLDRKVAAITGTKTIREHLDSLRTFTAPQVGALGAFRDSLEHLQDLDSEALQFLMQGTIDLASYRLDAWITSVATKRLASMRASQPQGVYIGGYGWVENLRPEATARTEVTPPRVKPAPCSLHVNDTGSFTRLR
jgi:hypothetical protein